MGKSLDDRMKDILKRKFETPAPEPPGLSLCWLMYFESTKFRTPFLLLITLLILFAEEESVDPGRLQLSYFQWHVRICGIFASFVFTRT